MTTAELAPTLGAACERWADRPAVTSAGVTVTYRELWDRVQRLAGAYARLGIGRGDRVVCQLPNSVELLVAAHAAWACGAVHVGVDRDLTAAELVALVDRFDAATVVYQPPSDGPDPHAALAAVQASRPATVTIAHGFETRAGDAAASLAELVATSPPTGAARVPPPADGCDLLLLTSGTTGRPKAVMETRASLWAKMQFLADAFVPAPDDVHLAYLPLAHAFGLKLALVALASGGRLVLMPRFSPEQALDLIAREGITILPGTPTHFALLTSRLDPRRHRVASLRWAITAAAPLPPRVVDQIYARLGVELLEVYGCSEGFLVTTTAGDDIRRGSVGRRVYRGPEGTPPDGSIAVVDPRTGARLGFGEVGEVVYGASCPVRYWDEPPAAGDGWYHTGDLGRLDHEGRLYLTGRLKDVVNRGGLKVAAGEVEAVLLHHPGVAECAVVAAPDPVLGEAICACVVPASHPAPDLAAVRSFLGERLARHKLPDELCVLPALPRSKTGKLDRPALTRLVADAAAAKDRLRAG